MHLIDCFTQLIAYVVTLRDSVAAKQPDYLEVKTELKRLVSQSENLCRQWQLDPEDFDQARFMVSAWVDEALLASNWNHKQLWQHEQLQRQLYNTTDAGVEVFERLNNLGPHERDVREVFYICLSLGFKGRFIQDGDEFLLEQLRTSNLKILLGTPGGIPSMETMELFPEAIPTKVAEISSKPVNFRLTPMAALALAGPALLFVFLYLVYRFALSGAAGKLS